jgi:hypothetical protein
MLIDYLSERHQQRETGGKYSQNLPASAGRGIGMKLQFVTKPNFTERQCEHAKLLEFHIM